MCKLGVISQEWLKIEVKLLLSADRKSYMQNRLAQQRMTLSDLEWSFHSSSRLGQLCIVISQQTFNTDLTVWLVR